ncbi:MAG: hypothetical protein COV67_01050, partial [Nitrospinae bacterium CG11_big_fil_rev_8_21_14_0_20_56_8]
MKLMEHSSDEIKSQIRVRAFDRFGRYGFGKTTMVEIARDCEMSAGNLYRYFAGKKEIGAACAEHCMGQKLDILRDVVRKSAPGEGAGDKLRGFVLETLRHLHQMISGQPLIHELVNYISAERWDIVARYLEKERALIAEIMAEGNRTGEFAVHDVVDAARFFQAGTIKFLSPHFMNRFSLEELEFEAGGVV